MTTISAKTILRSRNTAAPDKVLSTLLLRYPCCIHAEFMTHRAFSRNAASSRAIPVEKLIADIEADPFVPLFWGSNQKGMRAGEECNAVVPLHGETRDGQTREKAWMEGCGFAIELARDFALAGYHKQIVNRLLEPYGHITVLVSATEWDNFLELRDHADAEPHIQLLAREIRKCLEEEDTVEWLHPGEWHLPFIGDDDWREINSINKIPEERLALAKKLSVARCASTSYKTVDGFDMTLERAIGLHDKLVASRPIHASPCEHVAQADARHVRWVNEAEHGNFVGFRQYRHQLTTGDA